MRALGHQEGLRGWVNGAMVMTSRIWVHSLHTHMCHILLAHSSVDGHLVYLQLLTITNNAARNMGVLQSFGGPAFI